MPRPKIIYTSIATIALFCLMFIFAPLSYRQVALALGNYTKTVGQQLTSVDWNTLPTDFLIKLGDTWTGPGGLNMNNFPITGLPAPAADPDAANKQYVDDAIAGVTGASGDVFTNWGREDCPSGMNELYDGVGFSAPYTSYSGGGNPVCLESGDPDGPHTNIYADKMMPLHTTTNSALIPSAYGTGRAVKCSACFNPIGSCFVAWGTDACPSVAGFARAYAGFSLGSLSDDPDTDAFAQSHKNAGERICVNSNFDSGLSVGGNGAIIYGTRVESTQGLGAYTSNLNSFVKCAVCCN